MYIEIWKVAQSFEDVYTISDLIEAQEVIWGSLTTYDQLPHVYFSNLR